MIFGKIAELFQDTDGGTSMKRFAFFIFLLLFIGITIYVLHYGVAIQAGAKMVYAIPQQTLDFLNAMAAHCIDAIKWLGALILGDKAPAAISAFKGTSGSKVTTVVEKVNEPPVTGG